MRVLYARCFGLGNCVLSVPALKALRTLYGKDAVIDCLLGNTWDDQGAADVMAHFKRSMPEVIDNIFLGPTSKLGHYDVAVLAIPFDGRWQNGVHFTADRVLDGRPRPDPSTFGFGSWKAHEAEYQLQTVHNMGDFSRNFVAPSCNFGLDPDPAMLSSKPRPNAVFMGMGYKRDPAGQWKVKHWGNANYAELVKRMLLWDRDLHVFTSGHLLDHRESIIPVQSSLPQELRPRFHIVSTTSLQQAFETVTLCRTFVGNDTGMMHVAASAGLNVVGIFQMEGAAVKNPPFCEHHAVLEGGFGDRPTVSVEQALDAFRRLHYAGLVEPVHSYLDVV